MAVGVEVEAEAMGVVDRTVHLHHHLMAVMRRWVVRLELRGTLRRLLAARRWWTPALRVATALASQPARTGRRMSHLARLTSPRVDQGISDVTASRMR